MQTAFLAMLFIIGACLGSFLCCQARRLHLKSAKPKSKSLGSRSVCLSCHHRLSWYENLPVISWLVLGGKCRHCRQRIGCAELLSEIGLGLSFLALGTTIDISIATPLIWASFFVLLLFMTVISFLAIYDGLYGELPTVILVLAIIIAIVRLVIQIIATLLTEPFLLSSITSPLLSVLILGGLYLLLYWASKGKWVGDGDWLLATAIAIVLAHPWLATNALFVANLTACLIMLPQVVGKKTHQIHFGPFLVVGFVIVYSAAGFFFSLIGI